MKKYIVFSFLLMMSMCAVGVVSADDSGCVVGGKYSVTTGKMCMTMTPLECATGHIYSLLTGKLCAPTTSSDSTNAPMRIDSVFTRNLSVGSRGADVKVLQQVLVENGFLTGKIDGVFGPKTSGAVKEYQRANSIAVSGRVDSSTIESIVAEETDNVQMNVSGNLYLSPDTLSMMPGTSNILTAYFTTAIASDCINCGAPVPQDVSAKATWTSSDTNVALVKVIQPNCLVAPCPVMVQVTAVGPGSAIVTASYKTDTGANLNATAKIIIGGMTTNSSTSSSGMIQTRIAN